MYQQDIARHQLQQVEPLLGSPRLPLPFSQRLPLPFGCHLSTLKATARNPPLAPTSVPSDPSLEAAWGPLTRIYQGRKYGLVSLLGSLDQHPQWPFGAQHSHKIWKNKDTLGRLEKGIYPQQLPERRASPLTLADVSGANVSGSPRVRISECPSIKPVGSKRAHCRQGGEWA